MVSRQVNMLPDSNLCLGITDCFHVYAFLKYRINVQYDMSRSNFSKSLCCLVKTHE